MHAVRTDAVHALQPGKGGDLVIHKAAINTQFGHGADYKYSHDYEGGVVDQEYLPEERRYYEPTDRGYEAVLRQRLAEWRAKKG